MLYGKRSASRLGSLSLQPTIEFYNTLKALYPARQLTPQSCYHLRRSLQKLMSQGIGNLETLLAELLFENSIVGTQESNGWLVSMDLISEHVQHQLQGCKITFYL